MPNKTSRAALMLVCCLALASVAWAAPAHALGSEFVCKCKGIDDKANPYLKKVCGMGYETAQKGRTDTNIPLEKLGKYLDSYDPKDLWGNNCLYSAKSGWKCARMMGANNIVPMCVSH